MRLFSKGTYARSVFLVLTVFIFFISLRIAQAATSRFNVSMSAAPVSGWVNVAGDPATAVPSATDAATGIGFRSAGTAKWNHNYGGANAWNGAGQTVDDGGGFAMPAGVTANYWYNYNDVFSSTKYQAQVFGLNVNKYYTITLLGSRNNSNGATPPRIADYNVKGATALPVQSLDVWQNTSRTVTFSHVQPATGGIINIAINKKANNSGGPFGYLNGLVVTEETAGNAAPVANAGVDQSITLPSSLTLSGSGADTDGTIASYSWTKISGGSATIVSPTTATTSVTGLVAGTYVFRLTVTDNLGSTGTDDVKVIVSTAANQSPIANAGVDQTITLPAHSITLTGSGTDTDGTIASYAWSEASSGAATIVSPTAATTTVTDLGPGTYTFRLTVTDNLGATANDTVIVTVNSEAVTSCSAQKIVVLGSSTAAGYGLNPVSTSWVNRYTTYATGLNSANSVPNLALGGYTTYEVMPTGFVPPAGRPYPDTSHNITAALAQHPNAIIINLPSNDIANGFSVAEAESNFQTIVNTASAAGVPVWVSTTQPRNLDQAGINGQIQLRDWITATYGIRALDFWSVVANADGTVNAVYGQGDGIHLNALGHQKLFNRVAGAGILSYLCAQSPVNNIPTANAGVDQTITLPANIITLQGSGMDSDGTIASYAWSKVSGPTATITNATSATTTVTGLIAGVYTFRLMVTDNQGATATDDVTVTVNPAPNVPPTATAVISSVVLNGSGVDSDGTIASYSWTKISGGNVIIASPGAAVTSVTNLSSGTYTFRLTVTDDRGATAFQDVQFTL